MRITSIRYIDRNNSFVFVKVTGTRPFESKSTASYFWQHFLQVDAALKVAIQSDSDSDNRSQRGVRLQEILSWTTRDSFTLKWTLTLPVRQWVIRKVVSLFFDQTAYAKPYIQCRQSAYCSLSISHIYNGTLKSTDRYF